MDSTWTQLRSGAWGVRTVDADRAPAVGERLTVSKRDGSTSTVEVVRVLWTGPGEHGVTCSLCAVERVRAARRPSVRAREAVAAREIGEHGAPVAAPRRARRSRSAVPAAMFAPVEMMPEALRAALAGMYEAPAAVEVVPAASVAREVEAARFSAFEGAIRGAVAVVGDEMAIEIDVAAFDCADLPVPPPRDESPAARDVRQADERHEARVRAVRTRRPVVAEATPAGRRLTSAMARRDPSLVSDPDARDYLECWGELPGWYRHAG